MHQNEIYRTKQQNIIIITGIVLSVICLPLISNFLIGKMALGLIQLFFSRLTFWLLIAALFIYAHRVERQDFLLWKEKKYNIKFYLISILVLFLLSMVARIISAIPIMLGWHDNFTVLLKVKALVKSRTWAFLLVIVTAGVTEELLFRGYIQPRLALFFSNKYVPVILSAVLFSALHYRYFSLVEILFTLSFGIMAAVYYQKYRSISVLIVFHILVDLFALSVGK